MSVVQIQPRYHGLSQSNMAATRAKDRVAAMFDCERPWKRGWSKSIQSSKIVTPKDHDAYSVLESRELQLGHAIYLQITHSDLLVQ